MGFVQTTTRLNKTLQSSEMLYPTWGMLRYTEQLLKLSRGLTMTSVVG